MRWDLLAMSSLAIVVSTTQFFSPIAMQQLLRYLEDVDGSSTNPYLWAILILLGPLSWAVSREMYTFVATRVTVRVKAALTQLIYLKVMVMKANDGNEETSTGRISNLMSTDIETITTVRELFLLIVQLPVCTFVSLVLLYRLMGHAALLGFGGLLLTIPIPGFLANSMALYQRAASLATDLRLSVISENLNAIRITKLFGWEVPKTQLIIEMRYNEQEKLWKRNFVAIAIGFVTDLLPSLNMLATFFVFTLVMGYQLTASTAFTAIAYFEILRSQFLWVGYLSRNVIQSQVSIQRIEAFLNNAEEISPAHSESHNQTRFLSVTCAWSKLGQETRFMLKNVNISFGPGLTIVIGPTASGKSSLLMALLGEMRNGATLSGGQKQRIALARALYSNAQTLLLDDVLSALDAGMGAKIFKSAITGELTRGKTIVLVTHAVGLCTPLADQVVTMNNGYTSIRRKESVLNLHKRAMSDAEAVTIASLAQNTKNALNPTDRQLSNTIRLTKAKVITTHDEKAATGRISRTATLSLLQNFGSAKYLALLLLVQLLYQGLTVCKTLFPGIWADAYESEKEVHVGVYLSVYTILIFGESFMNAVCNAFVYHGNWTAAGRLHGRLLFSVFQAPLSWHDNTPVGRVLNRFSRDIQSLDTTITPWIRMSIDGLLKVTFSAISVATILPLFAIPAAVVGAMGLIIGELYTKAQISVKRLVSVSESPLFCHFGDSIAGIVTIRSFGAQKRFVLETESRIDDHTRPLEVLYTLTRWSQIRADSLGALVAFGAALLALMGKHRDSGLIGFSLATASGFSVTLLNLIRALNEMEVELNSFERIQEYSGLPQEPPDNAAEQVSPSWPRSGDLIVQNLCVKYSPDTPEILKDISFTLKAGEKIGVVGRSGSGKSTLALSLLRLTHHVSGSIVLDGKDIEDVNLSTLRRRITIIPQDPVLFSGTVRTNLDPFGTVSDALLQQALHHSGLDAQSNDAELTATRATTTLDSKVTEAGQNFSQGQRQILALARAIVRNSKLIIMDEATASCDGATDARIQETLRTQFRDSTVLTIAHRLRTICDYDRIMVMQEGKLIEMDSPANLMNVKGGVFAGMIRESVDSKALLEVIRSK
ncbi:Abc transporter [Taphrina deformans PYCC 5710]|uniref:Abc transporter n=1 Tax=Taphrina deformans (strain PYCC 5710 / ATCC 11124 / CBS 356.35 / IMI 108563 / JCM 9778 / NBRC 8474) TaxID=1097556 RepID=R4XCN0_TAPDE|nr:Abc transporter [Taphrina deformans PYCC 5710]|eukprot:CCG83581.1 Abc transporter [Taphrina deformans PYCC 5710]